jgi:hypothetical protein
MRVTAWIPLLAALVIACATAVLRPVEAARLHEVEVSGGGCAYEVVPLDVGVCSIREVDHRPGRLGQDSLVRCGEAAMVCERAIRCDCAQPKRLFDCEPQRTVTIDSDGGVTPVHPTGADGTPIPPLSPRRFEGSNEFGACRFSMEATNSSKSACMSRSGRTASCVASGCRVVAVSSPRGSNRVPPAGARVAAACQAFLNAAGAGAALTARPQRRGLRPCAQSAPCVPPRCSEGFTPTNWRAPQRPPG